MKKILSIFLLVTMILSLASYGSYAATDFNAEISLIDKEISISGGGIKSIKGIVTVRIDSPNGNIFNINQIKADENGNFNYTLQLLDTDDTGDYKVTVFTRETTDKISDSLYYLSEGRKTEITDNLNDEPDDLYDYRRELDIENFSDSDIDNAVNMLSWLKTDSDFSFEEIKTVIKRSKTVWNGIKACNENNLTGFLKTNSDVLFENEEIQIKYNSLSSANKRAVNALVLDSTYLDYDELRTAVKTAVNTISQNIQKRLINIQGDINVNVISIAGNGIKTARKIVTLKITDENGNIININQIMAEDDGTFNYSVSLDDNDNSGNYTVYAYSREIDEIAVVKDLYYLNKTTRDSITNNIKNAVSVLDIETILTNNAVNMGFSELSANDIKSASIVLKNYVPQGGYTYETICSEIRESKRLMDELNKEDWSTLDGFITDNGDKLLSGLNEYPIYKSISGAANRNKICKTIMYSAPFENLEKFRTVFTNAVLAGNLPLPLLPGGGGGTSSKGGTSSAIDGFNQYGTVPSGAESNGFIDLTNYKWAEESINGLLERGVISTAADGKYRPQDNVTREEFIKLLVSAFALTDSGAQCNFSDVPTDSWYYVYVASAYKNNITQGITETTFGTGSDIKRQEMASLAYRVIKNMNLEIKADAEEKVFGDSANIADYAKEAVSVMQKAGVINGDETGNFRPEGSATRAEAAKVIYMLLASTGR
ncbi:MAG: S-layer homology domain-containing protein [Clostridia bacterium]|nr:S-layer homology domain-containing protein [Clostridia bacterium]